MLIFFLQRLGFQISKCSGHLDPSIVLNVRMNTSRSEKLCPPTRQRNLHLISEHFVQTFFLGSSVVSVGSVGTVEIVGLPIVIRLCRCSLKRGAMLRCFFSFNMV